MKPFALPDAMISPFGGSRSSSSSAALSSFRTSADSVFVDASARSSTSRARPSDSRVMLQCRSNVSIFMAASDPFDQHRAALPAADADRRDAALSAGAHERVQQVEHDPRARRADRVTERDRAAVDVELRLVEPAERRVEAELAAAIAGV